MNKLSTVNLAEALSREVLLAVLAAMRPTAAFCLVVAGELCEFGPRRGATRPAAKRTETREAGQDERRDSEECATTGWLWIDGDIEPLRDRHMSLLLPVALHDGARVWPIELIDGHDQLLLASFEVQSMRVCMGVARHHDAPAFEPIDLGQLHRLASVAAQLAALHAQCLEHARRELVLRSLGSVTDASCVVDLDTRRVRWFYELDDDQPCTRSVFHDEGHFINLVERLHGVSPDDDQRPSIAVIGRARVVRTVDLRCAAEFDAARSLAVALVSVDGEPTKLSARERQIAQLLAAGYSTVNAAAIMSLSENTIRTYVRRLYRKLEITNRADLTRKCAELYLT